LNVSNILWIFFLISFIQPILLRQWQQMARLRALQGLERARGTRAIALIHRQETISLLGIPLARYIDIQDSEDLLRAIRLTPPDLPIDVILHTPGGLVLAAEQIARALRSHGGRVTVFVPHYAMSGGTLIALAADEIVMDAHAVLGPVDPQLGQYPAASIVDVVARKPIERVDDDTLILADVEEEGAAPGPRRGRRARGPPHPGRAGQRAGGPARHRAVDARLPDHRRRSADPRLHRLHRDASRRL
jgi:ClpP class serine protease